MLKTGSFAQNRFSPPESALNSTTLLSKGICMPSVSNPEAICVNERDLQRLQGAWVQTALEDSGVLNPVDEHSAPGAVTTISGNQFQVVTLTGAVLLAGGFTLDARTTPKTIIWVDAIGADAGKQLPASYRLEGDHFIFIAADEGMPRPTRFSTATGQTMRTFVRKGGVTSST
jgi:uncharacterized protein (TIGR03067 family)